MEDRLILVDKEDSVKGHLGKKEVHEQGHLHRAFSIFIFNCNGDLLMQRRALGKYHSGGLWSNTCCSHPRKGEELELAVHRRLKEEVGFDCPLARAFSFIYRHEFDNGMIENELDTVFVGKHDGKFTMNKEEACDAKWMSIESIKADLEENPKNYSEWFKIIMDEKYEELISAKESSA